MSQSEIRVQFEIGQEISQDTNAYSLKLTIFRNGESYANQDGQIVLNPELINHYSEWQKLYASTQGRLGKPVAQVTNLGGNHIETLNCAGNILSKSFAACYQSLEFSNIRESLLKNLGTPSESDVAIQLVVQIPEYHRHLRRLPWQLFFGQVLNDFHQAEVCLSYSNYTRQPLPAKAVDKVNILAIFGNTQGINLEPDRQALQQILGNEAAIHYLLEPTPMKLYEKIQEGKWDILFFAGHSRTEDNQGEIFINQTNSISLERLNYALKGAIAKGLKLAIFNSCDGLGLAEALANLEISQIIVMREIVPDQVAQEFLRLFLQSFKQGQSLHHSVRYAREGLKVGLETTYPFASWLPLIFQHPTSPVLYWRDLVLSPEPMDRLRTNVRTDVTRINFIGRDSQLQEIHNLLIEHEQVAIVGLGGMGKSELARQYAQEQLRFYIGGVCWLNAEAGTSGQQIVDFARTNFTDIPDFEIPDDVNLACQVQYCWRFWPEGKVLLIFDNVDIQNIKAVKDCLPPNQSNRFRFLLTTRQSNLAKTIKDLELDVLSTEDALCLLANLVSDERINQELEIAAELCKWLGCLPLGIDVVGSYLVEKQETSLSTLLKRLKDQGIKHRSTNKLTEAFEISWAVLDTETKQIACLLGLFASAPISWSLLEVAVKLWLSDEFDEENLEDAQVKLKKFGFLKSSVSGIFRIHPLIREFFRAKLPLCDQKSKLKWAICRAIADIAKKIDPDEAITTTLKSELNLDVNLTHIVEVANHLSDSIENEDLFHIFYALGAISFTEGLRKEGENWYNRNLEICSSRLSPESIYVSMCKRKLADALASTRDYSNKYKAIELATEAYKVQVKLNTRVNQIEASKCINQLGTIYRGLQQYKKAKRLHMISWAQRKTLLGEDDLSTLKAKNHLALDISKLGNREESLRLYKEILESRLRVLETRNHTSIGVSLNNVAVLLKEEGEVSGNIEVLKEALTIMQEAVSIGEKLRGMNHHDVASRKINLASIYREIAILSDSPKYFFLEAIKLLNESIEIRERIYGEDSRQDLSARHSKALLYFAMSQKDESKLCEAYTLCEKILASRIKELPEGNILIAHSKKLLGQIYVRKYQCKKRDSSILNEVEALYFQVLVVYIKVLGENHSKTKILLKCLEELLAIYVRDLGTNHSITEELRKRLEKNLTLDQ
jgi:tetratricopeptide (TPR) repeat protein